MKNEILEIKVKKAQAAKATKELMSLDLSKRKGYNKFSYRGGQFILDSIVTEIVINDFLGATREKSYDYDIIFNDEKIDVKTKPRATVPPQLNYNASVPSYQLEKQDCDRYIFTRINPNLTKVWVCGTIPKKDFVKKSEFAEKGSYDEKWKWAVDSNYIKISKLQNILTLTDF